MLLSNLNIFDCNVITDESNKIEVCFILYELAHFEFVIVFNLSIYLNI